MQTRIGIATGLVVDRRDRLRHPAAEYSASGETPNLAARLQARRRLARSCVASRPGNFSTTAFELGHSVSLALKGFDAPVQAWRVLGERAAASRFEAQHDHAPIKLIGRGSEVALLLDAGSLAREGEGKSCCCRAKRESASHASAKTLRERLTGQAHASVVLQCSPYLSGSALYPVVQYLKLAGGNAAADNASQRAPQGRKLAAGLRRSASGQCCA